MINGKLHDKINNLPYHTLFGIWIGTVLIFGLAYAFLAEFSQHSPTTLDTHTGISRLTNSIYFSVITATGTGFGDIAPHGYSRLFAALETFIGLFIFALFVSKLVSQKQDTTIAHMHRLSSEGSLHDLREDLHTVRADLSHLITFIHKGGKLSDDEWDVFIIASQQLAILIKEVPHFYDYESNLYRIDKYREELLLEAVKRTMRRFDFTLKTFSDYNIDIHDNISLISGLTAMLEISVVVLEDLKTETSEPLYQYVNELEILLQSIGSRIKSLA